MEITIKIEKEDEISVLKEILKNGKIQIAGIENISTLEKRQELIAFLKAHTLKLPEGFKFDREEANAR